MLLKYAMWSELFVWKWSQTLSTLIYTGNMFADPIFTRVFTEEHASVMENVFGFEWITAKYLSHTFSNPTKLPNFMVSIGLHDAHKKMYNRFLNTFLLSICTLIQGKDICTPPSKLLRSWVSYYECDQLSCHVHSKLVWLTMPHTPMAYQFSVLLLERERKALLCSWSSVPFIVTCYLLHCLWSK